MKNSILRFVRSKYGLLIGIVLVLLGITGLSVNAMQGDTNTIAVNKPVAKKTAAKEVQVTSVNKGQVLAATGQPSMASTPSKSTATTAAKKTGTSSTSTTIGSTPAPAPAPASAPTFPTASNVPTRTGTWPEVTNLDVSCSTSVDSLTLKPGQETSWMTITMSDTSNVYWHPFYKNVIWANGVNDSPTANYWMVLNHNPGNHIATGIAFKVRVSPSAPASTPPFREEVMANITDLSRSITMGCGLSFTIVN